MKHAVASLEGALLDAAVAKAEGMLFWIAEVAATCFAMTQEEAEARAYGRVLIPTDITWAPSTEWQQGGPILERERIAIFPAAEEAPGWFAQIGPDDDWVNAGAIDGDRVMVGEGYGDEVGPTPLIAAMRAFVASKFGDEVDLP